MKKNKPEAFMKALMLKEYEDRMKNFIILAENSAATHDKKGRVILTPDLKVRHKKSGFEYTIKKVEDNQGNVTLILRTPDAPRFDASQTNKKVLGGSIDSEEFKLPSFSDEEVEVSQQEFEKDYEVN